MDGLGGWSDAEVAEERASTPSRPGLVHLVACGAALVRQEVNDAVRAHLAREEAVGGYAAEAEAAPRLAACLAGLAELVGGRPDEVVLTTGATEAWARVFWPLARRLQPGDRVLTSRSEYGANAVNLLLARERLGVIVEVVPDDVHGQVDVAALEASLDERVRLLCLTHVPSNGGVVEPAAEVGRLARAYGIPYLLDAAQSVGQVPLDVAELGCDALVGTSRTYLRGPRGLGFLWVRRELARTLVPEHLDLAGATWEDRDRYRLARGAARFGVAEIPPALVLGLGVAVDHALRVGVERVERRVVALAEHLRGTLWRRPDVVVHDRGARRCGIVAFEVSGVPADEVVARLRDDGFVLSTTRVGQTRFDMASRQLPDLARVGVHVTTTVEELDALVAAVHGLSGSRSGHA